MLCWTHAGCVHVKRLTLRGAARTFPQIAVRFNMMSGELFKCLKDEFYRNIFTVVCVLLYPETLPVIICTMLYVFIVLTYVYYRYRTKLPWKIYRWNSVHKRVFYWPLIKYKADRQCSFVLDSFSPPSHMHHLQQQTSTNQRFNNPVYFSMTSQQFNVSANLLLLNLCVSSANVSSFELNMSSCSHGGGDTVSAFALCLWRQNQVL